MRKSGLDDPGLRRKRAANKFKPGSIRLLLVAESPPSAKDRYFYFTDVTTQDGLWVETMKHLYPEEFGPVATERTRKRGWLERLQTDGIFLIDAVKEPLTGSHNARVRAIRAQADAVVSEIRRLEPKAIVLIKSTVWEALHEVFQEGELPLLNRVLIPFPGSGQQRRFHKEMEQLGVQSFIHSHR